MHKLLDLVEKIFATGAVPVSNPDRTDNLSLMTNPGIKSFRFTLFFRANTCIFAAQKVAKNSWQKQTLRSIWICFPDSMQTSPQKLQQPGKK
jgi:hypothetical protein